MNRWVIVLMAMAVLASARAQSVGHRMLVAGCGTGAITLVGKDGQTEWTYPLASEASDIWMLPNGNVFFTFKGGVREVKWDKSKVWEFLVPPGSESQGCQPLGDNLFLVSESKSDGTTLLYEMDRSAKVSKKVVLNLGGNSHTQVRQVRKTPQGTYLVCQQRNGGKAMEFDGEGKLIRSFPTGRYSAERLSNGNTLISGGDEHRFIEVDPQDKIVWELNQNDVPGNTIGFAAGIVRLPNGNTIVCNWPGHGGVSKNQPTVFEVTPEKKLVWSYNDPKVRMLSCVSILDEPTLTPSKP